MGPLFMLGGLRQESFDEISRAFLAACGEAARIALLVQGGNDWEQHMATFEAAWRRLGVGAIIPVAPASPEEALRPETIGLLRQADGIFIAGGDTREYHRKYAQPGVAGAIVSASRSGTPVAGCSAGALILPAQCTVWGGLVTRGSGRTPVTCEHTVDQGGDGDTELRLADGIGAVSGLVTEVELTEWGRLPRLLAAMAGHGCRVGVGIDEGACFHLAPGGRGRVLGLGRVFFVQMTDRDGREFQIRLLHSGEQATLPLPEDAT